jgi:cytochrome c oxidase subunit 2
VLSEADFAAWYASSNTVGAGKPDITTMPGVKLMETKGCLVCHRLDGTRSDGPSLAGLFGAKVTVIEAGQEKEVVADEAYLRRALQQPGKALVKGYDDIMPSDLELSEQDVQTLIETLKALK